MPPLLRLLALCNLLIGTGAFVLGGILSPLAASLGVSVAAAGQAMTAYALATAVLAPLALVFTGRWPRKRVLCVSLAVFAAGNALCALAGSLGLLLAGRVLMGLGAVFTAVAAGNVCTEDVVHLFQRLGLRDDVRLDPILEVVTDAEALLGRALPGTIHRTGVIPHAGRPAGTAQQ